MNNENDVEDKLSIKEKKLIEKYIKRKQNSQSKYISKDDIKNKFENSKIFNNAYCVNNSGIIELRDGTFARVLSVDAIDLSLASNNQRNIFFNQIKYLFQIKDLNLRIYKLDDKIDLNVNKDYYSNLINKYKNDANKVEFLQEKYDRLESLEIDGLTSTSRYYFVITHQNDKSLNHIAEELILFCNNITPRLNVKAITNKLEIYQFLVNLYLSEASINKLMWSDLIELISPTYLHEYISYIETNDDEIQIVTIKNIPPFVSELFFEELFNVPDTRCCIHVKDTIPTEDLIKRLDSNYEFLVSERTTTRKLSDATEMDLEKENFHALMTQLKNGDEKIKEVDFIIVVNGNIKEREEKINELRKIADVYHIKLDVPRMRQLEGWQAYDISRNSFADYHSYLPTLTLASSFPLTITHFNDETGYMMGIDIHTSLPVIYDLFHKDSLRTSSNLAVVASTGGGKSYTLKKIIINELNRGNKCFIFDAEGEYENLVKKNGGQYIDMYSSSGGIINPLQVRFLPSNKENDVIDIDNINDKDKDCPLAKHLGSLEAFIKCAFEEITESEIVVLLDIIEKLYNQFGITKSSRISYLEKLKNTDYPIFTDLINFLPEYRDSVKNKEQLKIIDKLEILLDRFSVGIDAMLFNGYTSVNLDSSLIAFNVKDLLNSKNERITTTQLVNLLTYLNNIIVKNKLVNEKTNENNINIVIVVDEFHLYLKKTNKEVLLTFEQIARRIRKYSGSFIPATQSIHDFLGDDDNVRSATAIFNNCQYQLVGMLKEDDLDTYLKLFYQNPLTDTQKEFLMQAEMGQFLLTINTRNRIRLHVQATPLEVELMGEEKK